MKLAVSLVSRYREFLCGCLLRPLNNRSEHRRSKNRLRSSLCRGLLLTLCFVGAPSSADDGAALVKQRLASRLLDEQRSANRVPGMSAAVFQDGKIVWHGETGWKNLSANQKVDVHTRFRLASVSKILAATAAAKLMEQGKLQVDAPIGSMLGYVNPSWSQLSARQLATHTAGVPHYQLVDMNRGGTRFASTRAAVESFQNRDLLFPAGEKYSYSSYGYTLLSALVEAAAGESYLDYLQRAITPGLTIEADLIERYGTNMSTNMSVAYEVQTGRPSVLAPHDYSYSWGGAGMTATAVDLAQFGGRLMAGQIVQPNTLTWMRQVNLLNDGKAIADRGFRMGFGWRVAEDRYGRPIMHHAGVTGGARSVLLLFPEQHIAISILSNASWTAAIEQTALSLAEVFAAPMEHAISVPCPVQARRYKGKFGELDIEGTAMFKNEDGRCESELSVASALGQWLNKSTKTEATHLQLLGFDPHHQERHGNGTEFTTAVLVTPLGSFPVTVDASNQSNPIFSVKMTPTQQLSLQFYEASP